MSTRERGSTGARARGQLSENKGEFAEWIVEVAGKGEDENRKRRRLVTARDKRKGLKFTHFGCDAT